MSYRVAQLKLLARDVAAAVLALGIMPDFAVAETSILSLSNFNDLHPKDGIQVGKGPEELGLTAPFVRFTGDDQHLEFELACDPEKQNYFTVKVWGNSGSEGHRPGSSLLLHDPEKGEAPFKAIARQDGALKPNHHPRRGEIVRQTEANAFPGRFYYATHPIPIEMTRKRSAVSLRLLHKGQAPGLEVYRVYSHLDPYFEPPAEEVQGKPFELGPRRDGNQVALQERLDHWRKQANTGFRKARDFQLFGERWEAAKAKGAPEWAKGVILGRGRGSFTPAGPYGEDDEVLREDTKRWGSHYIRQADSQMLALRYVEVYAHAYTRMARRSFELYSKQVAQCSIANQMIHNFLALNSAFQALELIDPAGSKQDAEKMEEMAEISVGIRQNPIWGTYSYSPDGMPLEDGYDANYGKGSLQLVEVAELTRYPQIEQKARIGMESYAHFVYLSNDLEGYRTLRNTEWISARIMQGFPGLERYFLSKYAAKELRIPAAIRYFELQEEHGRDFDKLESLDFRSQGGLWERVMFAVSKANDARDDAATDMPPTGYRLPDEREEDSAFVDEYLGLVAVRHGDARMVASLNWESRLGKDWAKGTANQVVRLEYTTPTMNRLVTAPCVETKGGALGLNTLHYGPYFIVINGSEEQSFHYEIPEEMRGKTATDLLTGEQAELPPAGIISPSSSRIFALSKVNK